MANVKQTRQSACFLMVSPSTGSTLEAASDPPPTLRCRGLRYMTLFRSLCVYCLYSLLDFDFCNSLQVDCWACLNQSGSRIGREGPPNALQSSASPQATRAPNRGRATLSERHWLSSRVANLRSVHVHQQSLQSAYVPMTSIEKDSDKSISFHANAITGSTKASSKSANSSEVASHYGEGAAEHDQSNNLRTKQQAPPTDAKSHGDEHFATDRYNAAQQEKPKSISFARTWGRTRSSRFSRNLLDQALQREDAAHKFPQKTGSDHDACSSPSIEEGADSSIPNSNVLFRNGLGRDFEVPVGLSDTTQSQVSVTKARFGEKNSEGKYTIAAAPSAREKLRAEPWKKSSPTLSNTGSFNVIPELHKETHSKGEELGSAPPGSKSEINSISFLQVDDKLKSRPTRSGDFDRGTKETGEDFDFRLDANDDTKPRAPATKKLSHEGESEGDFGLSFDTGEHQRSEGQRPKEILSTDETMDDFNFSLDSDLPEYHVDKSTNRLSQGHRANRKVPPQQGETREDVHFSLNLSSPAKFGRRTSGVSEGPAEDTPVTRQEMTKDDFNFSFDSDSLETLEQDRRTPQARQKRDTEAGFNFVFDSDSLETPEKDRRTTQPQTAKTKVQGKKVDTKRDFNFSFDSGSLDTSEKDRRTPQAQTSETKVPGRKMDMGDFNFSFDSDSLERPEKDTRTPQAQIAKTNVPGKKVDTEGDFNFSFDSDSLETPEKDRNMPQAKTAKTKVPRQKTDTEGEFNFTFDSTSLETPDKDRRTPQAKTAKTKLPSQKTDTEGDFNFSFDSDSLETPDKDRRTRQAQTATAKVPGQKTDTEGDFNFSFDSDSLEAPEEERKTPQTKVPGQKTDTEGDFNFSFDSNSLETPDKDRRTRQAQTATTKVPGQKTDTEGDFNFSFDSDSLETPDKDRRTPQAKTAKTNLPGQKTDTEGDFNFSFDSDSLETPDKDRRTRQAQTATAKVPGQKTDTEGDFNFSFDSDSLETPDKDRRTPQAKTAKTKLPGQKTDTEGDFNFSFDSDSLETPDKDRRTPQAKTAKTKLPSQKTDTEGDFNFSFDSDSLETPDKDRRTRQAQTATAKVPGQKTDMEGDFNFSFDSDSLETPDKDRRTPQAKTAKTKLPGQKTDTEGDFNFSFDSDSLQTPDKDRRTPQAQTATTKLPSQKTDTEGDFNFSFDSDSLETPDKDRRTRQAQTATTKVPGQKTDTEGDFNFSFDSDSLETPDKDRRTPQAKTAKTKLPGQKTDTEGDFNFSFDSDSLETPDKDRRTPQAKTVKTKVPGQKMDTEGDFNFSFDLGSPGNSQKALGDMTQGDDESDVYTLLDEEEEYDEDEDELSSMNGGKSSTPTKARFKLTGATKGESTSRTSAERRASDRVKAFTKEREDFEKEFYNRTAPASLPAAPLPSDSWYKLNTATSSADFVKSLEAQRARQQEARNALREKRLDAPLLTNMYTRAVETVPATNYLGVGYDAIKGNPLGDPTMMADPGLRSPVISFAFEQSQYGVTNDLSTLQPLGAYTRPFAACRQSETVSELSTLDDYQKELTVDAFMEGSDMLGLNRFSGSTGYQNFAKQLSSKETKSYLLKTYCIRYEAGIAQTPSFNWNYTLAFRDAVSHLPTSFDGQNEDTLCNVLQWRQDSSVDACADTNIPVWMDFIQEFGTHYIVRLFAGGKMTFQVALKSSDVSKLKNKGVDVNAELKLMLGGFGGQAGSETHFEEKSASNVRNLDIEKETLVIGGRPPGNVSDPAAMAQWADTVEELPMPVKIELQSLGDLLPEEKRKPFEKAAKYYGKAYGMSVQDLQILELAPAELPEVLGSATQVAWAGPPPGYAKCPAGSVVLFGYAMKLNFNLKRGANLASYSVVACAAGREKCDGVGTATEEDDDERIFVVCGKEPLNDLYQIVASSPYEDQEVAVATCPDETVLILGFGLAIATGGEGAARVEVESCRTGQTTCTKNVGAGTQKSFVWAVCAEKNYPGVMNLSNENQIDARGPTSSRAKNRDGLVTVACPEDQSILLGFALEVHTHMPDVRETYTTCDKGKSTCSLQGAGVDTAIFGRDRHSLLSWVVCSPTEKEVAHAVVENPESGKKYETEGLTGDSSKLVKTGRRISRE